MKKNIKKYLIVLFLTAVAFGINPKYYRPQINTTGLIGYWKLQYGFTGSTTVFDYSLKGGQGTVSGAVYKHPGMLFDGATGYINCGSGTTIDNLFSGGGSVAVWAKNTGNGEGNAGRILDKNIWTIYCNNSQTQMLFQHNFDGGANTDGQWTFNVAASFWQHIVIVYDNGNVANNPIVYVNGISVTATEATTPADTAETDAAASLYIGNISGGDTNTFDGLIGDVLLFSTSLSAQEAKAIYEISRWGYQR